jgi:hypothetical protein
LQALSFDVLSRHYYAEWLPSVFNEAVFSLAHRATEKTLSRIKAGESATFPTALLPLRNAPTEHLVQVTRYMDLDISSISVR